MVSTLAWVALALAALGVVGSLLPAVPGATLSLAAVLLYWWSTGYTDPSLVVLVGFALVALAALVVDVAGSALAVRAGGASPLTAAVALVAGLVLGLVTGPLGFVVGVAGAAFAVELYRTGESEASVRAALYATVGVLGSAVVQALLTLSLLVALAVVVFL
ncbi:DUF456 domain-containing protein [Salinigranum rubrum]|uniref:DUF456 domain-containing protein n=1 Tax=Salinigranum rubrum TaxID=755307 RepID=A0A2I8VKA3_9EURY|nr:DUF456 domain-containing protein [Salinigranum rubrum]AUV82324.1 DUF456 domain-containing protein [Salinigranum rubrum]